MRASLSPGRPLDAQREPVQQSGVAGLEGDDRLHRARRRRDRPDGMRAAAPPGAADPASVTIADAAGARCGVDAAVGAAVAAGRAQTGREGRNADA